MDPDRSEEKYLRVIHDEAETTCRPSHKNPDHHDGIADSALWSMLPAKRHRELLRLLQVRGQLTVREVANYFRISVDTARRDFDLLAREHVLNRTYGGAVAPEEPASPACRPDPTSLFESARLLQLLGELVRDGETLLVSGRSTTKCCAKALGSRNLRLVTNCLDFPFDLITGADVCVLGGKCCPDTRVTVGPITISGISINADCAVIAVDGIMAKEGLTTHCLEEAVMASRMIAAARRTIVVADSSRFGKRFFARISPIESMRILITDKAPSPDLAQALQEARVETIIVAPVEAASPPDGHGLRPVPNGKWHCST
jgi:DeoR family transcriptional regulator, fructose operon transcriptional repressor